jgi:hypothetical protein
MRMDLATTVSWREELETALDRLLGVVAGKRRAPRPTSPTVPRASGPQVPDPLRRISPQRRSRNAAH